MLRLPTIRAKFPDSADAAAPEQMSYNVFLAELLMAERGDRARRRSERLHENRTTRRLPNSSTNDFHRELQSQLMSALAAVWCFCLSVGRCGSPEVGMVAVWCRFYNGGGARVALCGFRVGCRRCWPGPP